MLRAPCWNSDDDEDKLFLLLKCRLRLKLENAEALELDEGEILTVPNGVRHNPVAAAQCHGMLDKRQSTPHAGEVASEKAR